MATEVQLLVNLVSVRPFVVNILRQNCDGQRRPQVILWNMMSLCTETDNSADVDS